MNIRFFNSKFVCVFFTVLALITVSTPAHASEWDPRLVRGTLANGFSYIIYDSEKSEDPFNIRLIVHAGSVDEDVPSGVAHILEHMAFQSTNAHPETIHRYLQGIGWKTGLQVNAVTRETETQYMIRTRPADVLDVTGSLALMSDIALGAKLLDDDWQREKLVIREEMRQGDSVASRINRQKKDILRIGSRYVGRPTIGTLEGIEKTTVSDIRAFHEKFYVASNMTLIVSGNVDTTEAVAAINTHFGRAPLTPAPERSYVKLPLSDRLHVGTVQEPKGSSEQVTFGLRLAMPDRRTNDGQFAYLQNYFLTRLIRDEVERYARHYRPHADALTFVSQETTEERLIIAFNARTDKHDEAWPVLLEVIERLRREGLSATRFTQMMANAKRINLANTTAAEARTFAEWDDKITSAVLMTSILDSPDVKAARLDQMLKRVTLEGLNDRLREMLSSKDRLLFYQLAGGTVRPAPRAEDVAFEESRLSQLQTLPPLPVTEVLASPSEAITVPDVPEGLKLPQNGAIVSETTGSSAGVTEWRLSNGDRVIWLERETPDGKVYISAQAQSGFLNGEFDSILSQTAIQLWQQSGFNFWTQDEFDRWNDTRNGRWSWVLKPGLLDVAVAAKPAELPGLLREYAMSVVFGTVRDEALKALPPRPERPDDWSIVLYGSSSAPSISNTTEDVTLRELRAAGASLTRAPVTWFAVGPTPDSSIKQAFQAEIAGIERAKPPQAKPLLQQSGINNLEVRTFDTDRAKITMSFFSTMNWTPEGAFITSALTPLAQQALKNKLRLELGGLYSLQFELDSDPGTDRITGTLSFYCDPSRVDELVTAAIYVFHEMPNITASADTERLRSDIDFAERARLADPNTWLRRLALSYRRYNDAGYLERMYQLSKKVTPDLLSKHAKRIFDMQDIAILKQLPTSYK